MMTARQTEAADREAGHRQPFNHPLLARSNGGVEFQALKPAFEGMAAALLASTRKLAATAFTFTLVGIEEQRTVDHLMDHQGRAVAALFDVAEPSGTLVILLEKPLVFSLVEAVLGGDGLEKAYEADRSLSKIERSMARLIADHAAQAARTALGELMPFDLDFDRLEADLEFIDLGRSSPTVLAARLNVEMIGRTASFSMLLPARFASALSKHVVRAKPAGPEADPAWASQLGSKVREAEIRLDAVFVETGFTLADVAALKVGQILALDARQSSPLTLQCDSRPLFRSRMGQSDGRYAARIEEALGDQSIAGDSLAP